MRYSNGLIFLTLVALILGCKKPSVKSEYFDSKLSIGLIVLDHEIQCIKYSTGYTTIGGPNSLKTSYSLKPEDPYYTPLMTVKEQLRLTEKIKKKYFELLSKGGRKIVLIDSVTVHTGLFKKPNDGRKYDWLDNRPLKEAYGINELLIITPDYGIITTEAYGIKTSAKGFLKITSTMVNIEDNSILYKYRTQSMTSIKNILDGAPQYKFLGDGMKKAIDQGISKDSTYYSIFLK